MAIVLLYGRPALRVTDGDFGEAPKDWPELEDAREHLRRAIACVGRIDLKDHPFLSWVGTGMRMGPERVVMARSSAQLFTAGVGDRQTQFTKGPAPEFVQAIDLGHASDDARAITRIRFIHPALDAAAFELEHREEAPEEPALTFSALEPAGLVGKKVAVVGFSTLDSRSDPAEQQRIYGGTHGVLFIQPGQIRGVRRSPDKPAVLLHDCTTLGGASGSPIVDLETGEVLGVHFGGMYLKENIGVPSWELARDKRVREHGLRFSDEPPWMHLWTEAESRTEPPKPPPPPPKRKSAYFDQDEAQSLIDLLIEAGYGDPEKQRGLVYSMDLAFIAGLPTADVPADQLRGVLDVLNRTPRLMTGELPMEVLLKNAIHQTRPRVESQELERLLAKLKEVSS